MQVMQVFHGRVLHGPVPDPTRNWNMCGTQSEIFFHIRSRPTATIPTAQFMMFIIVLLSYWPLLICVCSIYEYSWQHLDSSHQLNIFAIQVFVYNIGH